MPLTALHCKRVSSALRAEYRHLSPALGLISANSPFLLANLESFPSTPQPTVRLVRDLFANKGDRWAITQSRSKASFYLDSPQRLAHVLGMALTGKEADADAVLGGLGIGTNRVDGARTGVSLQKYRDVVANLAQAVALSPEAIPIYMQLVWQRAKDKRDLWRFYKTLEEHYLPDLLLLGPEHEGAFVRDNFTPQDFSPEALTRAGLELADLDRVASTEFADSLDLVAANLSTSTWKPVWKLVKHELAGQSVYDCVEVVVREFVDMLLFDEAANAFGGKMGQALAEFYGAMPQRSEEQNSRAWFALCQRVPQCDYLQPDQHELFPSLENVLKCAAHLLGLPPATNQALAFCQAFNAQTGKELWIEERREMFRPALSDESQRREIALCRLGSLCIELTLVRSHRLATAKHSRVGGSEWVVASRPKHLEAWSKSADAPPAVLASCFWPAFLQDQMLDASGSLAQQLTSAPWGADRERNWSLDQSLLGSELTLQEQAARKRASQRVLLQALRRAVDAREPEAAAWLLTKAGVQDANGVQLACALWRNQTHEHAAVRAVGDLLPKQARDLLWGKAPLVDRARFAWRNLVYY